MKFLLLLMVGAFCVWYFAMRQRDEANVLNAIESRRVVIGMTSEEAKLALGNPISSKRTESLLGSEETMTFAEGKEITFTRDRATKIATIQASPEIEEFRRAMAGKAAKASATQFIPSSTALTPQGWRSQMGGTALDRRPYTRYDGYIYYSTTDDPNKLGTATETDRRNGLERRK